MRILVTGAAGFIGTCACSQLNAHGHRVETVTRVDRKPGTATRCDSGWLVQWPEGLGAVNYGDYDAVLHLAIPKAAAVGEDAATLQCEAMRHLIRGVESSRATCSIVFLSSQSSSPGARSAYGRGKWQCEQLLAASPIRHVVVRPGLVVSRADAAGLFGQIVAMVRRAPVVPVPHSKRLLVQPVTIEDVARVIVQVLGRLGPLNRSTVGVALAPRGLPDFVRDVCWELRLRRVVVPIPLSLAKPSLRAVRGIVPRFPLTPDHLDGLAAGVSIDPHECARTIGIQLSQFGLPRPDWPLPARRAWEAVFLSRHLFARDPSPRMIERYVEAHERIAHLSAGHLGDISTVTSSGLLLEALERATRSPASPLTGKLHVLCSLAEIEPAFQECFRLDRPRPLAAWCSLAAHTATLPLLMGVGTIADMALRVSRPLPPVHDA